MPTAEAASERNVLSSNLESLSRALDCLLDDASTLVVVAE
jgi:hypothetical protein